MTFIALPIVPDDPVGPFGGVNPREVWIVAIMLAGASFVGYAAVKYFGARPGVLLAGAAGGLDVIDRCHHRQCAMSSVARRIRAPACGRRGNGKLMMFLRVCFIVFCD